MSRVKGEAARYGSYSPPDISLSVSMTISMPSFTVTPLKMPTVQAYSISLTEVEEFSNELLFEVTPISNTANARFHCSSASRSKELILWKAAAEVKLYFTL